MQPWLRRMPHEIDERYAGRVMFPGFIDPHTHLRLSGTFAGLHYVGPVELASPGALPPVDSRADVLERLRLLAADAVTGPDGRPEPVVCWGYDPAAQGGHLDRDLLDQVSDAVPIWVCAYAPHIVYTNSPMLELADVDEESVNESHDRSPRAVPR